MKKNFQSEIEKSDIEDKNKRIRHWETEKTEKDHRHWFDQKKSLKMQPTSTLAWNTKTTPGKFVTAS